MDVLGRFKARRAFNRIAGLTLAVGIAGFSHAASAGCISSTPIAAPEPSAGTTCSIAAAGTTLDMVFVFQNAADTDVLVNGVTLINNKTSPIGTLVILNGLTPGQAIPFLFKNMATGLSFMAGTVAADGDQHIALESKYSDFQSDPPRHDLTAGDLGASLAVMTAIAPISEWTFVGLEDLLASQHSDFDYNDLIVGVFGIANPIPEPASMALVGAGLLGLGIIRRRGRRS